MSEAQKKLDHDLDILEAMAAEMELYLKSDVQFWKMGKANMPDLTLGGYLMRQHRLLALADELLDESQRERLGRAVRQFNQALTEKIVRFEQKAHQELQARLRQWEEYLRDLDWEPQSAQNWYGTAVDTRAIISALIDALTLAPYKLESGIEERVEMLDKRLRSRWQSGDFVWPDGWQEAYPKARYWWLYGQLTAKEKSS